jgi:hypothetical protein
MNTFIASLYLLLLSVTGKTLRESDINTAGRYDFVVSIPDVHGDLEVMLRALWMAKVEVDGADLAGNFEIFRKSFEDAVKANGENIKPLQSSKRVLLIQTGDIIDRGAASLSCYKAIWQVENVLGWDVVNLFGNHEVMTMAAIADNYAHPKDIQEFGSIEARRAAFAPGGPLWKRLTDTYLFMVRVQMAKDDSTLFVHAGLDHKWLSKLRQDMRSIGQINEFLIAEVKRDPESNFLASASSPIWTRDLANGKGKKVCDTLLPKVLDFMKVERMVVGHTPQESLSTAVKCDAKLILADVAMSRWMGSGKLGNPSALIFQLANDGADLQRVYNVYWKGSQGQSIDQLIYQPNGQAGIQEL